MPKNPSSATARFNSMAAFDALCNDNDAKAPNLDVSLAMASESLSFTVTAMNSASVGSDIP